ncbi:acetyltransferase [Vibrio cholerae]|nr:acetyltransferase [Vibrio cholerae]
MVAVVVFEFSGMRCQPLRRALGLKRKKWETMYLESLRF